MAETGKELVVNKKSFANHKPDNLLSAIRAGKLLFKPNGNLKYENVLNREIYSENSE